MSWVGLLMAILVLQAVVDEPADLRLVAQGPENSPFTWHLPNGTTETAGSGEPVVLGVAAGTHLFWVEGPDDHDWVALARPESYGGGVAHVEAWVAHHRGVEVEPDGPSLGHRPAAILLVTAGLAAAAAAARR